MGRHPQESSRLSLRKVGIDEYTFPVNKTVSLNVRRRSIRVHRVRKALSRAKRRNPGSEAFTLLKQQANEKPATCAELAKNLREARKLMTEKEHRLFGEHIERGIKLMRRERLH